MAWRSSIAILLAAISHCTPAFCLDDIVIRANSSLPDALIAYIADIAVPSSYERKGLPIDVITRTVCGFWNGKLDEKVRELNPLAQGDSFPNKILLPACVYSKRNAAVSVIEEDNLDVLLRRESNVWPTFGLKCSKEVSSPRCGEAIEKLVGELNPGIDLAKLKVNSTIVIPFRTRESSIKLKPGLEPNIVLKTIRTLAEGTAIARLSSAPALVTPMNKDNVTDPDCNAASARSYCPWPFDVNVLSAILARNVKTAEKRKLKLVPSVVAVLDTGIVGKGDFLPNRYFAINFRERESPLKDWDRNGYDNDVIGTDVAARYGDVTAYNDDPYKEHGSEVANLVLGGRMFRTQFTDLEKLIQLKIVKIVKKSKEQDQNQFDIPETAIHAGLKYAKRVGASVANISAGGSRKNTEILPLLESSGIVAVVAAGNSPQPLDDDPKYPANFGGFVGRIRNVITVAAHDSSGKRASFTNYGSHFADIAAPGCDLPYKGTGSVFGTSFATPLVSFTVALMRSFWNFDSANSPSIKERLEVSVDFDKKLRDDVAFSGRLNVIKAVSVFDDVVKFNDETVPAKVEGGPSQVVPGKYLFGTWNAGLELCEEVSDFGLHMIDVKKITPTDNGAQLRVLYHAPAGNLNEKICKPASPTFEFSDENQRATILKWSSVADLVPRMRKDVLVQGAGSTNTLQ